MTQLEFQIQKQITAFLADLAAAPRHPTVGYLGAWVPDRLVVMASGLGADGNRYINDPGELVDGHPDVVLHAWLRIVAAAPETAASFQPGGGGLDLSKLLGVLGGFTPIPAGAGGLLELLRSRLKAR